MNWNNYALYFSSGACVSLCGLLFAEKKDSRKLRYFFKPVTSLLFVCTAVAGNLGGPYGTRILYGLLLSFVGDIALMYKSKKPFLLGLVSFLLAHIFYIFAFLSLVPFSWEALPVLAVLSVMAIVIIGKIFWKHLGGMRVPVIIYVTVISVMVWRGWIVFFYGDLDAGSKWLAALGATFFYGSDIAVAIDAFIKRDFKNRLWGLPLYYLAQFLLAFSVAGIIT